MCLIGAFATSETQEQSPVIVCFPQLWYTPAVDGAHRAMPERPPVSFKKTMKNG